MASDLVEEIVNEIMPTIEFDDQSHYTYLRRTLIAMCHKTNIEIVDHRRHWLYIVDFIQRAITQFSMLVDEDVLFPLKILLVRKNGFESMAFKQMLIDYFELKGIKLSVSLYYGVQQVAHDEKFDLAFVVEEKNVPLVEYINDVYRKCNAVVTIVHV